MSTAAPTSEQATWQLASALLAYPDEQPQDQLSMLRAAAAELPVRLREPLHRHLDAVEGQTVLARAAHYTEVFDHQRRCCLYLTYYAHGDTRKRGMALLAFKRTYAAAGLTLAEGELPDHLAVVLEFAATVDADAGRRLLLDHRAGVELLRLALEDAGSPYAHVVAAVCATLPPLRGDEREAVARLAAEGPPVEEVGLSPFEPPAVAAAPGVRR